MESTKAHRAQAWRRGLGLLVGCALALGLCMPAAADTGALKRSIQNLTEFPFDIALSPITAGTAIYRNMRDVGDSPGVRIAYPVPGYFWNIMVQGGTGIIRGVTGLIELPVGIVVAISGAEFEPLFDPAENNEALLELDSDIYNFKVGIDYTTTY